MNNDIKPSKFYFVNAKTSLQDCLDLMKEKSLSFLLIENNDAELVGIFTLKDLLKNHQYLSSREKIKKPIRVFMTQPVLTISSTQLDKAPQLMLRKNIRHLPITSGSKENGDKTIGVVDMESFLAHALEEKNPNQYQNRNLSVYSPNGSLLRFLKNILKVHEKVLVEKLWASKVKNDDQVHSHIESYDLLLFDLVDEKALKVALTFARGLQETNKKMIGLVDTKLFSKGHAHQEILQLSKMKGVKIFGKPVNVHDLISSCLN